MFCVPGARERGHAGVTGAMLCAVMEYCVAEGITWIGGVQETYWLPRWQDFGWEVQPLGLPQPVDGVSTVAAFMKADGPALEAIRAVTDIDRSQIIHRGPRCSFLPEPPVRFPNHSEERASQ